MSLLIVGTIGLDTIKTPFGERDKIIGGSAAYISLAASQFTKDINIISIVGDDLPESYIQILKKREINIEGLQIKKGKKSFFWSGEYHNDMNTRDTLITELNVLENFDPILPNSYQNSSYLILGNNHPSIQKTTMERLRKRPKLIAMDTMNIWIENIRDELIETMAMVDILSINDEEARQLSKEYSLIRAARKIMDMGPKTLIIKKGENGALLFQEKNIFYAPALPLEEIFDPTGAGDTFIGGFIGYLSKTDDISFENMKRAVIYGSALASFCVEKFGIEALININDEAISNRVNLFGKLVKVN